MTSKRTFPYIWTTWLPKLLTGDSSCEWAVWLKAHFQEWERVPSNFNQADWLVKHTALLNAQKAKWEKQGHHVHVEGQNAFRLRGQSATLSGKPDLIVFRDDDDVIVNDVKTGREQPWHVTQVLIYMYALPKALRKYENIRLSGEVTYPTHSVKVPQSSLNAEFVQDLGSLIQRLASDTPSQRAPSVHDCRFCDISRAECPERVAGGDQAADGITDDF